VNFAVETEQPLAMSGSVGQAGLSGSREKAYMAYRRARPGQVQA